MAVIFFRGIFEKKGGLIDERDLKQGSGFIDL